MNSVHSKGSCPVASDCCGDSLGTAWLGFSSSMSQKVASMSYSYFLLPLYAWAIGS